MTRNTRIFEYQPPPGLHRQEPLQQVIVVGAGPIGLSTAIELANHGVRSVILDDNDRVATGSRAICWSKRSLEIFDRLGIGDRAVAKGVTWKIGRTYHRDRELFNFDLLPEDGHKRPAFINLQQYYVEEYLVDVAMQNALIDLRFLNRLTGIRNDGHHAVVDVETPDGTYSLTADYVVACDGAKSTTRSLMGLEFTGAQFEERFLIADIEMKADFPSERRFWFEPDFHNGQSALLHKQPDNIYRIDLQLGWDADPQLESRHETVIPRIARVVNTDDFRIDWVSVYAFRCCRLERFVHGRVIFAGDSAHVVSPFGARGGNSGLQDVDALCWRLAAIIQGRAEPGLLQAYNVERVFAADENIANSVRTTRFMTPASSIERIFRNQLLKLATDYPFARSWINSGRLSVPSVYPAPDSCEGILPPATRPGAVAADAPQKSGWLMDQLGRQAILLTIGRAAKPPGTIRTLHVDMNPLVRERYLGNQSSAVYLVRPDQVIAARWTDPSSIAIERAHDRIWSCDHETC